MQTGTFNKADGEVEVDETFIGGKARNMHAAERKRKITGTGGADKTVVIGALERGGDVRAAVVANRSANTLTGYVRDNVTEGAAVYTTPSRPTPGCPPTTPTRRSTMPLST
ncbi:MAG: transposase [Actinomycetota bacterium]|nr:transposase [Actinomycetota bacterium]